MSQSANVRSVDTVREFKAALTTFSEEARVALTSVEMEIRRIRDWLQRDQAFYWQSQVKRCNEMVAMARTELHRRRLSQQNSDAISDTEQKENLRKAERRLAEAEEKVKRIKKWIPVLEHEIAEYHSASQPLGDCLAGSLQNSLALLERISRSLESYLELAPPPAPALPEDSSRGAESARSTSGSTGPVATESPSAATPAADVAVSNEGEAALDSEARPS